MTAAPERQRLIWQPHREFSIVPVEQWEGKGAAITLPKEIACFSYDEDHNFHLDDRSLRYYYPPHLGADLSAGYDSFRGLDNTEDEHLDGLLRTIIALEQKTGEKCHEDFVTWRGMMTKILHAPYERFDGFEMNATLFQGTIFIEEHHDAKLQFKEEDSRRETKTGPGSHSMNMMWYWGYKFETLSLIPDIWDAVSRDYIESRDTQVVSNLAQYCSVVHTGIGSSSLILGGEVDAVWDCKTDPKDGPNNWVELKTMMEPENRKDKDKRERKLCRMWIQSFLLGVPKIVIGYRTQDGILTDLEELETMKIPGLVRNNRKTWDGNACINFAASFLEFLRNTITEPGVWRIRRRSPRTRGDRERSFPPVEVYKVEDRGTGRILSPEFLDWRQKLEAQQKDVQTPKGTCA